MSAEDGTAIFKGASFRQFLVAMAMCSLMPSLCAPPGEKRSGEQSWIPWAYSPEVIKIYELAKLLT